MNTALIVMDFQNEITDRYATSETIESAREATATARERRIPVVFVRVAFRSGYPEVSPANRNFSAVAARGKAYRESAPGAAIHPALSLSDDDILVTKRRVGAFSGTDLDLVLRSKRVSKLVLAGVTTSGVVLSTVRAAADLDYELTVLSDACADPSEGVHRLLMETIFPRQGEVRTVANWRDSIIADAAGHD